MDLKEATIEQIKEELLRRREEEAKASLPQPKLANYIDTTRFIEFAVSIRDSIANGTYHEDNDNGYWAYELIMDEVFGKSFWEWANKRV